MENPLKNLIYGMDLIAKINLISFIEESLVLEPFEITTEVKENRFSKGKVCPHCKTTGVSRYGTYDGNQRYICKSCRRTFSDLTNSPRCNSHKDVVMWIEYAKCMVNGYSLRKCASIVGISLSTSFFWRHKLLDALRTYMDVGNVGGVVEVDESFFRESFKGNHSKSSNFKMPRKPNKRGGVRSNKVEKRKRGISNDQVCVLTALDRTGNIIIELICKGRMKHTDLERLFEGRVSKHSIFCADSHKSYIKFAENFGIELKRIEPGHYKQGIYHIQHINAMHSKLKEWMYGFHSVATKYLSNYMCWFKWLQLFNTEKDAAKVKDLLVQSHTAYSGTKIDDFKTRKAIYM
jgi:transposase-like protein